MRTIISVSGMTVILRGGIEIEGYPDGSIIVCHSPYEGQKAYVHAVGEPTKIKVECDELDVWDYINRRGVPYRLKDVAYVKRGIV